MDDVIIAILGKSIVETKLSFFKYSNNNLETKACPPTEFIGAIYNIRIFIFTPK